MTNSFRPQAQPVDTFVRPVSVAPPSDLDVLARALKTVNPGIEAFLGHKMDEAVEDEKVKGRNIAIDQLLNEGDVAKLSNKIRKTDGDDTARQLIGGSIFADRAYQKTRAKLSGLKLQNLLESEYASTTIDTGEVDTNGQPIFKFLNTYPSDSEEFIGWRQTKLNEALAGLNDLDPSIVDEHFIPTLQSQLYSITNHHTKEYKKHQFDLLQSQIPDTVTKAAQLFVKGENDQAQNFLIEVTNDMYNAGVTGEDAKKTHKLLIKTAFAKARKLAIDVDKPLNMQMAEDLPDKILQAIPYGKGNLTDHPDYLPASASFEEEYEQKIANKLKNKSKVDDEIKKRIIKLEWEGLNNMTINQGETEKEFNERRKAKFAALLNDPLFSSKDLQTYVQELGESDNYELDTNIIPGIKNKIIKGIYDGYDDVLEQEIAVAENKHLTMDDEAIQSFNNLKTFAKEAKGIGAEVTQSLENIMKQLDRNLGAGGGIGFLRPSTTKDFERSTRIRQTVQTEVTKWYQQFVENNNRLPSPLQKQQIETQYLWQILGAEKVGGWTQEEIDKKYPPAKVDAEGKIISGYENPFYEPLAESKDTTTGSEEKGSEDSGFLAPGMNFNQSSNQPQNQSEDLIGQLTNLIGQLTPGGGSPVAAGDLKGKPLPDYGGLAELVRGGESAGSGLYNAYNGGTTDSAAQMDITSKTIAEMEQMQKENKVFAVGAYQFTPGVLAEAREYAGLEADSIMTPAVQDRLFWGMILSGKKRPALTDYLEGRSDDLKAAQKDLAYEFAAIQGPDGVGMYDNDSAGNYATIKSDLVKQVLINARKAISNK